MHAPNRAGYKLFGRGWCHTAKNQSPPMLYKKGAGLSELKNLCNKFKECIAVDHKNNAFGYLRFISASAVNSVSAPSGYTKGTSGLCQSDCEVTRTDTGFKGECWVKETGPTTTTTTTTANGLPLFA